MYKFDVDHVPADVSGLSRTKRLMNKTTTVRPKRNLAAHAPTAAALAMEEQHVLVDARMKSRDKLKNHELKVEQSKKDDVANDATRTRTKMSLTCTWLRRVTQNKRQRDVVPVANENPRPREVRAEQKRQLVPVVNPRRGPQTESLRILTATSMCAMCHLKHQLMN
jgi:hypothetical protein